jgi:hypothetical protein
LLIGPAEESALAVTPAFRVKLERAVERLLAKLDALDGDADLEDTGDAEPSLGAPERLGRYAQDHWAASGTDDREEVCEDEGAQCDDEGCDPDREDGGDAEPDAPGTTGTYHPEDQRLVVSGGFAGRTFYLDLDTGRTVALAANDNPTRDERHG